MKIFNLNNKRNILFYGVIFENNNFIMSSFSEIKTKIKIDKCKYQLIFISKNLIGNGIFYIDIVSKNTMSKNIFEIKGVSRIKNTINFELNDDEVEIIIYRDKKTTGKIEFNSVYILQEKNALSNEQLDETLDLISDKKNNEDIIKENLDCIIQNDLIQSISDSLVIEVTEKLNPTSTSVVDMEQNIKNLDINIEEKIKKTTLKKEVENIDNLITKELFLKSDMSSKKDDNNQRKKRIKKEEDILTQNQDQYAEKENKDLLIVSDNIIDKKEEIKKPSKKLEKIIINIFDFDLIEEKDDILKYSSQISFAKKNQKFLIKNNKNIPFKKFENVSMFLSWDDLFNDLLKISFDKISYDKSITDSYFLTKLNEVTKKS